MKNSCLYKCKVMHHRLMPKENRFQYSIFMFCIDLDEIDTITKAIPFISHNRFNLFNFRDKDHLQLPNESKSKSVKEQLLRYLSEHGIAVNTIARTMLVTNLSTLGYQFNPVSFYFCYDIENKPLCSVVEVCNTYGEMKLYLLDQNNFDSRIFTSRTTKHFYVSPFIAMDTDFDFRLSLPGKGLKININDFQKGELFFTSNLTGIRKPLTTWNVLRYAIRFPFITLQVITLIHWQAFKLWMKNVSYYKKASFINLQKEVLRPHKSLQ